MRKIDHQVTISTTREAAFSWFKLMDQNYINWHPDSHQSFIWITPKPIGKDSVMQFSETIKGKWHEITMRIDDYREAEKLGFSLLKMKADGFLPTPLMSFLRSIFRVRFYITHTFDEYPDCSVILRTHQTLGSSLPLIGKIVDIFIDRFLLSFNDHIEHVKEESEFMKAHLEKAKM